jgi:hypothetical protein
MRIFGEYIYITGPVVVGLIYLGRGVYRGLSQSYTDFKQRKLNSQ